MTAELHGRALSFSGWRHLCTDSAQMDTMTTASIDETLAGSLTDDTNARWPALFVGLLLARSFGLAAGVALMILLVAALFSTP